LLTENINSPLFLQFKLYGFTIIGNRKLGELQRILYFYREFAANLKFIHLIKKIKIDLRKFND